MTLRNDEFWDALVEQIVVEKGNEVVLIPKVGNFRIVLASTVPRGVALHLQGNPEAAMRQTAVFAVCVHAFVAMKPKG